MSDKKIKYTFVKNNYLVLYIIGWLLFFRKCGVIQCGLREVSTAHKKKLGNFIFQKSSRNHVKVLADWCWQYELRQIGWFSPRFLELFWNIKMAQKIFMSSWDLSQPSLNYPTFSKKLITQVYTVVIYPCQIYGRYDYQT